MPPIRGHHYTRKQIAAMHGGGTVEYLPNVDGLVVCACLRTDPDYDPEAPRIILPGRGPEREHWAAALCNQGGAIPVYLKRAVNNWQYVGNYEVERWSDSPDKITHYEAQTGRPVTRVIWMREVKGA